jgi:regulator of replication initiation timing
LQYTEWSFAEESHAVKIDQETAQLCIDSLREDKDNLQAQLDEVQDELELALQDNLSLKIENKRLREDRDSL